MLFKQSVLSAILVFGLPLTAIAEEVKIAVAANFTAAMKEIAAQFEQESGHETLISYGSTGKLYAQIIHNAPFEVFLAADQERPRLLHEQALGQAPWTYAVGKLVLWSQDENRDVSAAALSGGEFRRLALANPKTAPYGLAALEVLDKLGLTDTLNAKLVRGDSIAQTHQFVSTGNAELGFVALAQIVLDESGARWVIPQTLYNPIRQDVLLLKRGEDNPAAQAFVEYLKSPAAQAVIKRFGYDVTASAKALTIN
jgi:molybdate transport system substrate-binding protein